LEDKIVRPTIIVIIVDQAIAPDALELKHQQQPRFQTRDGGGWFDQYKRGSKRPRRRQRGESEQQQQHASE